MKPATLYAYASRGLLASMPGGAGRARLYQRADLEALKARGAPGRRSGDAPRGPMRFGEPILESAVTAIRESGPAYRGIPAVRLAEEGRSFEAVAELLWTGALPPSAPRWEAAAAPGAHTSRALLRLAPRGSPPHTLFALVVAACAAADPGRFDPRPEAALPRARALIQRIIDSLRLLSGEPPPEGGEPRSIAARLARALRARGGAAGISAMEQALVLSSDHELNTSTFAARVAASAGADIYACIGAALAAFSGPLHGGACDRIEALVAEVDRPESAQTVIAARTRRGEPIPGFGHALYPAGDPRTVPLLRTARAFSRRPRSLETLLAVVDAMSENGQPPPTLDLGLVAIAAAMGLLPGAAGAIFAVGRMAGWVAHALEQRASGVLLRPRARYIGP